MAIDVIENRRSIRKYKPDTISKEILEQILEAGRLAPSGKNRQPWKFVVFGGEEKINWLNAMESGIEREKTQTPLLPQSAFGLSDAANTLRIMRQAPIVIAVLNTQGTSPFEPIAGDERFAEIVNTLSIGAAIENMLLQAASLQIGTLWIANTCFAYPELMNFFQESSQLAGAIALGIAEEHPSMTPRKALEDIVEYRL